jgi:hypothetical protein
MNASSKKLDRQDVKNWYNAQIDLALQQLERGESISGEESYCADESPSVLPEAKHCLIAGLVIPWNSVRQKGVNPNSIIVVCSRRSDVSRL